MERPKRDECDHAQGEQHRDDDRWNEPALDHALAPAGLSCGSDVAAAGCEGTQPSAKHVACSTSAGVKPEATRRKVA